MTEFLPTFLSGVAYEVVERVSGFSYDSVLRILHERCGQPAAVAAACIESLAKVPKLQNNDYILVYLISLSNSRLPQRNSPGIMNWKLVQWRT